MPDNVLLIEVDQMNAQCMSILGNTDVSTANLDRLAHEGRLFRTATCQSPICMPSRASMLTGQYLSTCRQFGFGGMSDMRSPWLQGSLKRAGYRTGAFGKFHLHNVGEEQWDMDVAAPSMPEDHVLARPDDNTYMHYCRELGLPWPIDQMHCHIPPGCGVSTQSCSRSPSPDRPPEDWCRSTTTLEHSLETWTTNRCIDFLRESSRYPDPFFAWLTYDRPHGPMTLPEPWFQRMRPHEINLPAWPSAEELGSLPRWVFNDWLRPAYSMAALGEENFRWLLASYYTLIEFIDSEIGRVMDTLAELDLARNTTVIFTADHGDQAGCGCTFDKGQRSTSEAITRVPLIIRPAPSLRAAQTGTIVDGPVELVDLFPTICSLSGIATPDGVEGMDLTPVLLGVAAADEDRPVFCEEYYRRAITHRNWKLVFDSSGDENCVLFDLGTDSNGFRNRYSDPACREKRLDLKRRLLAFLSQRIFGPYTGSDIDRVERAMDPDDPTPGLCVGDHDRCRGLHCYRAAMVVAGAGHALLVPFYCERMLVFKPDIRYRTRDEAIPFDVDIAEPMLNDAIVECMLSTIPASMFETRQPVEPPPTPDELRVLLDTMSGTVSGPKEVS